MKGKCGCGSCGDKQTTAQTRPCENCVEGIMVNKRVVCYDGLQNGASHEWITVDCTIWTGDHGWSHCNSCNAIGIYYS